MPRELESLIVHKECQHTSSEASRHHIVCTIQAFDTFNPGPSPGNGREVSTHAHISHMLYFRDQAPS
eukprot:scaffold53609_cov36-Phaeocystis_antarctica.AAC.2